MQFGLISVVFILVTVQATPILKDVETEWMKFKQSYGKQYRSLSEDAARKAIFQGNYKQIVEHNRLFEKGAVTYFLKINQFSDLSNDEKKIVLKGYKKSKTKLGEIEKVLFKPDKNEKLPDDYDWRSAGVVTKVKNQGDCASGWAFSAAGTIEGQLYQKTKNLINISAQNFLDCADNGENSGCHGGDIIDAIVFVYKNQGIASEQNYPYKGKAEKCHYKVSYNITSVQGYGFIEEGNEADLKAALKDIGPIAIAVDASQPDFQNYGGGIYYSKKCESGAAYLDHAMLLVGYGTENGHDYWLVKNSWGIDWGVSGYIKMARNKQNNCGIATEACYPLL